MIKINLTYFITILLFISCFSFYTSTIFFNTKFKKIVLQIIFYYSIISILFLSVFINKIDLLDFSLYLALVCIVLYILSNKEEFKIFLILMKSLYIFLLSFTTIFSLSEMIIKENIYFLTKSEYKFLIIIILSLCLYGLCELWFLSNLDLEKLNYTLSSLNILVPISILVLLIGKNYSLFYILNFSRHSYLISVMFLASTFLEIYFSVIIIIAISKAYDLSVYKYKNQILNMQYDLQVNNLNQLEEYQADIRRISHDIHNHKSVIYNLIKEKDYENALKYLESYGTGFSNKNYEILTNHKILNALFLSKKDICLSNNIDLNLDINIPQQFSISDFDLCIIIGNLMDNAIEACKKIDSCESRYINVKSKFINSNFIFEIKNNFNGSININQEKILTSKKDTLNHGLGISNVKSTVNKYKGNCELSFKDNEFTSFVVIPLN